MVPTSLQMLSKLMTYNIRCTCLQGEDMHAGCTSSHIDVHAWSPAKWHNVMLATYALSHQIDPIDIHTNA